MANRKVLVSAGSVVLIVVAIAACAVARQNSGSQQTWKGFVTDIHCGTNCQVTKDMTPDKKCVRRCVRQGSKYGLWVEHRVYPND